MTTDSLFSMAARDEAYPAEANQAYKKRESNVSGRFISNVSSPGQQHHAHQEQHEQYGHQQQQQPQQEQEQQQGQQQAPPQPTILLIVVNKPDGPPGSNRGYPRPGSNRKNCPNQWPGGSRNYPGYGGGYPPSGPGPGSGPRSFGCGPGFGPGRSFGPGPGPGPYSYPPPGPGPGSGPGRQFGPGPGQNYMHYNGNSQPQNQKGCRCSRPEDHNWTGNKSPCNCVSAGLESMPSNLPRPRNCRCNNPKRLETTSNSPHHSVEEWDLDWNHIQRDQVQQEVIVTDIEKKAYRCIKVPICIQAGQTNCCRCCKCAAAPDPEPMSKDFNWDEECTCNPQGKCNCIVGDELQPQCECDLTNLERILQDLMPNKDCFCYVKKRRRRKRKKWAPKKYYDRFANPPYVINSVLTSPPQCPPVGNYCNYNCCNQIWGNQCTW
ncbi:hypothetical protein KR009_002725 [Drosophila setifemur]|nr:hypothetical protein KR009_002725 [Drosophila setifemur]